MTTVRMTGWDKWQSYRRDRGTPPWIKVHRNLMSNAEWASLSDSEKGQLVSMWVVAADKGGEIPSDPNILRKVCQLDEAPNINKFIELQFIEAGGCHDDAKVTPDRRQGDAPETEAYIIEEERKNPKKDSCQTDEFKTIVNAWNEMAKRLHLPKVEKPTPKRVADTKRRIKDYGLEAVLAAIPRIGDSEFLCGKTGWVATFDFFLRPDTIAKITEGSYDDRRADQPPPTSFGRAGDKESRMRAVLAKHNGHDIAAAPRPGGPVRPGDDAKLIVPGTEDVREDTGRP